MEKTLQPAADDRLGPRGSLPRPWDAFDAYLFDVDGTLLNCKDAVHYFAFCEALKELSGRELNLEGVTAHGNTDIGILRDALILAGVSEADWRPRISEACNSMGSYVENNRHSIITNALPATREVLQHLRERKAILSFTFGIFFFF